MFNPDYLGGGFSATFVNLTVNGDFDLGAAAVQGIFLGDDDELRFGNTQAAPDAAIMWNTTQTVDGWYFGTSAGQNTIIIAEYDDRAFDFAHGAQANPTVFVHSANQATNEWIGFYHDQANAYITTGTGALVLDPAGNLVRIVDDDALVFGNSNDARFAWETVGGVASRNYLNLVIAGESRNFIISADFDVDWGHAASTNPTLFIHSSDENQVDDWIGFYHNQTDGVIDVGNGTISILDDTQLTFGTDKDWGLDYDEAGDNVLVLSEGTVDTIHIKGSSPSSFSADSQTDGNDLYWRFQDGGSGGIFSGRAGATWTVTLGDGSDGGGGNDGGAGGDIQFTVGDGGDGDGGANGGRGGDFIVNLGSEGAGGTPGGHGQFRIERGGFTEHIISAEPGEEVVFNDQQRDINFRVEGNDIDDLLSLDAGENTAGIGVTAGSSAMLAVDRANLSSNMSRRVLDIRGFTQTISGNTGMNHRFNEFSQNTITGAFTVTTAATLYIEDATSLAGGASATGGNYALWSDAGLNRFDGDGTDVFELPADAIDPTGGGAVGRIPVRIGGATVYLAYY